MEHQLAFRIRRQYRTLDNGITIPVLLSVGDVSVDCFAKIDTGASYCLFQREYGEGLGLNIESGEPKRLETLTGVLSAFGHEVTLQTFEIAFDTTVYFAADYELPRNLLGRNGWLQQMRLGLVDYDGELYLSHYNDL